LHRQRLLGAERPAATAAAAGASAARTDEPRELRPLNRDRAADPAGLRKQAGRSARAGPVSLSCEERIASVSVSRRAPVVLFPDQVKPLLSHADRHVRIAAI